MEKEAIFYIITLVLFVIVIIGSILCWIYFNNLTYTQNPPPQVGQTPATFGTRCLISLPQEPSDLTQLQLEIVTPMPCAIGLFCDPVLSNSYAGQQWGICRRSLGSICDAASECPSNVLGCFNVCSNYAQGGLNQIGPCVEPYVENSFGICKIPTGVSGCSGDADCGDPDTMCKRPDTNYANDPTLNTCIVQKSLGETCVNNNECISNNCYGGYCQQQGIEYGLLDSVCNSVDIPCNIGLGCYINYFANSLPIVFTYNDIPTIFTVPSGVITPQMYPITTFYPSINSIPPVLPTNVVTPFIPPYPTINTLPLINTSNSLSFSGTCQNEVSEWPENACSSNASCLEPSICWNGTCVMPRTFNNFITNSCSLNNVCLNGYKCGDGQFCVPDGTAFVPYPSLSTGISLWIPNTNFGKSSQTLPGMTDTTVIPNGAIDTIGYWNLYFSLNTSLIPKNQFVQNVYGNTTNFTNNTLSVLTIQISNGINVDILIYLSNSGWMCFPPLGINNNNITYAPIVFTNTGITIINIQFTYNGGLLVTYSVNGIYRCYLFPTYPVQLSKTTSTNYSLTLGNVVQTSYSTSITTIDQVDIDDRPDTNGNIKVLIISNNNLYIGIFPITYLNTGDYTNTNFAFMLQMGGVSWGAVYSLTPKVFAYNEYIYKISNSNNMILNGNTNVQTSSIPPLLFNNSNTAIVMNQSVFTPQVTNLSDLTLMYLVNYGGNNGIQLRISNSGNDVIYPGYFSWNVTDQICVSKKVSTVDIKEFSPSIYVIGEVSNTV